jgi:putative ABC transport system ATP-binding protein
MKLIKIHNLTKHYRAGGEIVQAVRQINLDIEYGEFLAIMGPSGSGKSTLLSIIGGLNRPTKGKVIVDGIDIYSLPKEKLADFRREYIGFVFQSFQLVPYLTVIENVMLPLAVTDYPSDIKIEMAERILDRVGLKSKLNRLPDELSGGEQERVAIARALVNDPPIILADEPTGNLDTATGREIMELFKEFNNDEKTIIMVTHNPENVNYARNVIYIRDGQLDGQR